MIQELLGVLDCAKQCMQDAQERTKLYTDQKRSFERI